LQLVMLVMIAKFHRQNTVSQTFQLHINTLSLYSFLKKWYFNCAFNREISAILSFIVRLSLGSTTIDTVYHYSFLDSIKMMIFSTLSTG